MIATPSSETPRQHLLDGAAPNDPLDVRRRWNAVRPAGDGRLSRRGEFCLRYVGKGTGQARGRLADAAAVAQARSRRAVAPEAERVAIEAVGRAMGGVDQRAVFQRPTAVW